MSDEKESNITITIRTKGNKFIRPELYDTDEIYQQTLKEFNDTFHDTILDTLQTLADPTAPNMNMDREEYPGYFIVNDDSVDMIKECYVFNRCEKKRFTSLDKFYDKFEVLFKRDGKIDLNIPKDD